MSSTTASSDCGFLSVRSSVPFEETVERLLVALERRGMAIYARVDHAKDAAEVGIELRPTRLFVFGYFAADAPVIARNRLAGIDLPPRMLIWEDEKEATWISYNDPGWIGRRHTLGDGTYPLLEAIRTSLAGIAAEAGAIAGGE